MRELAEGVEFLESQHEHQQALASKNQNKLKREICEGDFCNFVSLDSVELAFRAKHRTHVTIDHFRATDSK